MKTESTKSIAKQAQETAKKSIQTSLITELKAFAAKLGHSSKKINKEIEKAAKFLSKKLSKPVKAEKIIEKKAGPVAKATQTVTADKKSPAVEVATKPAKKVAVEKNSPAKKTGK
jgi:hypothetical protein